MFFGNTGEDLLYKSGGVLSSLLTQPIGIIKRNFSCISCLGKITCKSCPESCSSENITYICRKPFFTLNIPYNSIVLPGVGKGVPQAGRICNVSHINIQKMSPGKSINTSSFHSEVSKIKALTFSQ